MTWRHGGRKPGIWKEANQPDWSIAVLFVGAEGMLITQLEVVPPKIELYPKRECAGFQPPPQTIAPSIGHAREWLEACKTGGPTTCGFDDSGPLTETVLPGNVASRTGKKLQWDAKKLKAAGRPEADQFVKREHRKGWTLWTAAPPPPAGGHAVLACRYLAPSLPVACEPSPRVYE